MLPVPEALGFPDAAFPLPGGVVFWMFAGAGALTSEEVRLLLSRENGCMVFLGLGKGESKQTVFRNVIL